MIQESPGSIRQYGIQTFSYHAPVPTTTNRLYTYHCILAAFALGPHSVAQGQKLSPVRTQDLHRERGCNVRRPGNGIEDFHFQ